MVHYSLSVTGIIYFKILKEGLHVYAAGNPYTLVVTKNQRLHNAIRYGNIKPG